MGHSVSFELGQPREAPEDWKGHRAVGQPGGSCPGITRQSWHLPGAQSRIREGHRRFIHTTPGHGQPDPLGRESGRATHSQPKPEPPADGGDQAMRFPAVKPFVTYMSPLSKPSSQSRLQPEPHQQLSYKWEGEKNWTRHFSQRCCRRKEQQRTHQGWRHQPVWSRELV